VQSYYPMSNQIIVHTLHSLEELDGNPLLFALHESRHDLGNAICVQGLSRDALNIVLIVFCGLSFLGLLRHNRIPLIVVDPERLDGGRGKLGTTLSLGFATNEASAIVFAAIARLRIGAISVDIVVEDEFFSSLDCPLGKNAHT
jgi:hypothetical protein